MNKPIVSIGQSEKSFKNNVFVEILLAVAAKPHILAEAITPVIPEADASCQSPPHER